MDREAEGRGDDAKHAGDYQRVPGKLLQHIQNAAYGGPPVEDRLSHGDREKLEGYGRNGHIYGGLVKSRLTHRHLNDGEAKIDVVAAE